MFPRARFIALFMIAVSCCFTVASSRTEEPKAEPKQLDGLDDLFAHFEKQRAETAKKVPEWKKKYGFQSLGDRLEYEASARNIPAPSLGEYAEARLARHDSWDSRMQDYDNVRAKSLQMLHTLETKEFVERSGFGVSRRPQLGAENIELRRHKLEELAKLPPLSAEEAELIPTTSLREGGSATGAPTVMTEFLPTQHEMFQMHDRNYGNFVNSWSFGWVKSRNEIAGFEPHQFNYQPSAPPDAAHKPAASDADHRTPDERYWKLTRLELVSLLKHATPRVYESDQLPTMEQLSSANAKTRPLAKFETAALEKLRGGDDIHTSSTPNRIEMLGAIRASKQCLQCHEVPRGTLLGAFSYELRRDPPLKIAPTTGAVQ